MAGHTTEDRFAPSQTMIDLEIPDRVGQTREELLEAVVVLAVYADMQFGRNKPNNVAFSLQYIAQDTGRLLLSDSALERQMLWDTMNFASRYNGLAVEIGE